MDRTCCNLAGRGRRRGRRRASRPDGRVTRTPGASGRETGGSEPSPEDLRAMLSASAGLGGAGAAAGAAAGPAALLASDDEDDGEYGPKQPAAPKARAPPPARPPARAPGAPPRRAHGRRWALGGCASGARAPAAAPAAPARTTLWRSPSRACCCRARPARRPRPSCSTYSATLPTWTPCRSCWRCGAPRARAGCPPCE